VTPSLSTIAATAGRARPRAWCDGAMASRAAFAARSSAASRPFSTCRSRPARTEARPFSAAPPAASNRSTSCPACAATCAMPAPIAPAPMTATAASLLKPFMKETSRLEVETAARSVIDVRAFVLDRPGRRRAEPLRRLERPVGLGHQRPAEDDEVGLAVGQHLLAQVRAVQETDRAGRDAGPAADGLRERQLIAGMNRDLLARIVAARGAVDQIDMAVRLEDAGEPDAVLDVPAALDPFGNAQAHEQRQLVRPFGPHRL